MQAYILCTFQIDLCCSYFLECNGCHIVKRSSKHSTFCQHIAHRGCTVVGEQIVFLDAIGGCKPNLLICRLGMQMNIAMSATLLPDIQMCGVIPLPAHRSQQTQAVPCLPFALHTSSHSQSIISASSTRTIKLKPFLCYSYGIQAANFHRQHGRVPGQALHAAYYQIICRPVEPSLVVFIV